LWDLVKMSFLWWPAEETQCGLRFRQRRKRIALDLIEKFQRAFPEIAYDLLWESASINAQAWRLGSSRYVRLYGGIVRHRAISKPGLAVTLAHETGHHLGGLPRDPAMRWMTWQGQADYWAARTAMPLVFGSQARNLTLRGARQILRLHEELMPLFEGDEPDMSAQCRYHIFRAGASGSEIPDCAKAEYQQWYLEAYPCH
jgi:hypothetical protein